MYRPIHKRTFVLPLLIQKMCKFVPLIKVCENYDMLRNRHTT